MHWYNTMHFARQTLWHAEKHSDIMTDYALATAELVKQTRVDDISRSWEVQHEMYQSFGSIMEAYDIFICPTNTAPAVRADHDPMGKDFRIDGEVVDPEYGWILTHHFNMLYNCPVMAVPSGFASNGVPTGIQIVGRTFDDLTVFQAAYGYEQAVGGWLRNAQVRPVF